MSELDDFLKTESEVGQHESAGQFGLNLERARAMLAKYQLPEPDLYILKVIQAAVAGGARRVRIYPREAERYKGLEVLWDQPPQEPSPRVDNHMTAGLLAFLAQGQTACHWMKSDGEVIFLEGHPTPPAPEEAWWSHRLWLQRHTPPPSAWQRLTHWLPGSSAEAKRLAQGCTHAPIPIFFEGQVLNRLGGRAGKPGPAGLATFEAPHTGHAKGGYLLSREASTELIPAPPQAPERRVIHLLFDDPDDSAALEHAAPIPTLLCQGQPALYCWASVHTHNASWSEATFILDGVCLEPERNLLDRPGYQALISARGLTTTLSGLEIVHNELYFERLKAVKALIRKLENE